MPLRVFALNTSSRLCWRSRIVISLSARLCHEGYGGQAHEDLGFASRAPHAAQCALSLLNHPADVYFGVADALLA